MNRRGFLGAILAVGVAPEIVKAGSLMRINPEILVVPHGIDVRPVLDIAKIDAKIASIGGNRLLTVEEITKRNLEILNYELVLVSQIDQKYDEQFQAKIGAKVNVRRPLRFA